ncbi:Uncharacterized protein TCM_019925 [Theobroma cacao]|uniref:Secreted protein n=1 Tax=Theobroma cacao TaxID=3641 RepID=A0A061EIR9_THECC|nr:Uncharacterized protein TCM_019925 [Theobroma cacao]
MCQALALTAVLALIWRRFGCPVSCEIFQFLSVPFQSCFLQENAPCLPILGRNEESEERHSLLEIYSLTRELNKKVYDQKAYFEKDSRCLTVHNRVALCLLHSCDTPANIASVSSDRGLLWRSGF